jgi:glyoxylate reductase
MRPKVFVAQAIPEAALNVLRQAAEVSVYPYLERQVSVDELVAAAKRSDWLFVLHETSVTAEVINANPNLKGIGCMAGAHSFIDMEAANARKIPVVMGDSAISVIPATGDLTLAMLLALAYRLVEGDRYTRCGNFRQEQTIALMGTGCPRKTVGLVGMGKLALHLVPRLRAFEMHVVYNKPTRLTAAREQELGVEWAPSLLDLLRRSDFVCIACRYGPSTHRLIGKRELEAMKPDAYLINTGRGRIVDELELVRALQEKQIAGAALDVSWNEP